ncbi:MAG: hypothetical protein EAY66_10185 [Sphingobacteriales bacterium]|jgi:2-succinyl-5-enolpyruvyl-6-hydroxy-3-cyclohexene-1-carboxylate synthase|nr:MAG: hypothetical protein EAY66_10185 [Sphingobacteriales bacterium]
MEQLIVNISDTAVSKSVKAFLKTQKGVQFNAVFKEDYLTEDERHQQIMAASDAAHAGEKGVDWEDFKRMIKELHL